MEELVFIINSLWKLYLKFKQQKILSHYPFEKFPVVVELNSEWLNKVKAEIVFINTDGEELKRKAFEAGIEIYNELLLNNDIEKFKGGEKISKFICDLSLGVFMTAEEYQYLLNINE